MLTEPDIRFDADTRTLIFGMRPCDACGYRAADGVPPGRVVEFPAMPCVKCKRTGKRGNGNCRECKHYRDWRGMPAGMVPDHAHPYAGGVCTACKGSGEVPATRYDYVPRDIMRAILAVTPVRLYPSARELTRGESLLGMLRGVNTMGTCVDYGRSWERFIADDAEGLLADLTERIAGDSTHQALTVCDEHGAVVDHIGILLARNGYTVVGIPWELASDAFNSAAA